MTDPKTLIKNLSVICECYSCGELLNTHNIDIKKDEEEILVYAKVDLCNMCVQDRVDKKVSAEKEAEEDLKCLEEHYQVLLDTEVFVVLYTGIDGLPKVSFALSRKIFAHLLPGRMASTQCDVFGPYSTRDILHSTGVEP